MRKSRILSIATATALIAGSSLIIATPASASTIVDDATFYGASDFGVESGGYPTGVDWFFGDVSGTEGAHSFSNTGLTLNDPATGDVQILNQNVATPLNAIDLQNLADNADVYAQNDDWNFQLAFFAEGTSQTQFTTLRPATAGPSDLDGSAQWVTSQAFSTYSAGDTDTFANLAAALYAGEAPTLLAYGVFIASSQTTTINGIVWDDAFNSFGAVPTRTISPSPITTKAFSTPGQGLTLSGTNWFPGSVAYIVIYDAAGNELYKDTTSFTVNASGTISVNVVLPTEPAPGNYYVTFDDDGFYFGSKILNHYVSAPGEGGEGGEVSDAEGVLLSGVLAPELANTGIDAAPLVAGGLLVLLLGVGLVIATERRRRHV